MLRLGILIACSANLLVGGCATLHRDKTALAFSPFTISPPQPSWESLATPRDQALLAALGQTWTRARAAVPGRLSAKLGQEGPLLRPDAALDLPALPPGPYYCRLVRLGGRAAFASFKPDFCSVDGSVHSLSFTKQSGSNLPGGWLFPDTDKRQIFLGTLRPTNAKANASYRADPAHAVAGVVERVGSFRWRLVLTRAGGGALLDIYELVPVTPHVPGAVPAVPES